MSITLKLWLSQLISASAPLSVHILTPAGGLFLLSCVGNSGTDQLSGFIFQGKRRGADPLTMASQC